MYEFYENKKYFLDFDVEYFSKILRQQPMHNPKWGWFGISVDSLGILDLDLPKYVFIMAHELIPNYLQYVYKSENVI